LFIAGAASSFEEGIRRAAAAIDSGAAKRTLEHLVAISTSEETAASV
jgi:anthranilate phosphoribosyltransferase